VLSAIGAPDTLSSQAGAPNWYHPGRSGALKLGDRVMAYFGELHPEIVAAADLKGSVAAFEVFLDAPPLPKAKATKARSKLVLSAFQPLERIRNFSIVAHIDHGKSTLADRLIQMTGGLAAREMKEQVLDSDGYRARARHHHQGADRAPRLQGQGRQDLHPQPDRHARPRRLRLRGLALAAACEGSLLVVDASQGVEAQTLANVYQAIDANHEIVPVLNKIDLPAAEPDRVKQQIEDVIGIDASDAVRSRPRPASASRRARSHRHRLPPPKGDRDAPLKACWSTAGTTPISASSCWCASSMAC
jgi:hypothetical protein